MIIYIFRMDNKNASVGVEGMDEARTQMQEVKQVLLITKINKTNKNYPVGEKQTGRLADWPTGWTGQGRT